MRAQSRYGLKDILGPARSEKYLRGKSSPPPELGGQKETSEVASVKGDKKIERS